MNGIKLYAFACALQYLECMGYIKSANSKEIDKIKELALKEK